MFKLGRRHTTTYGQEPCTAAMPTGDAGKTDSKPVAEKEACQRAEIINATDGMKEKKKIGHRRVDLETGEVTYKKVPTSQLMGAIQFGIANSIGSLARKPERDLLLQDFEFIESVYFPAEGTHTTPSHPYGDFRFKTYAPIAFRYFRDLFSILPEDFLASLCGLPLRELSNPGVSGSIFYISSDDKFIIKTVQRKEADFLQKLLPGYYMNLNQNPKTLLPKFFGLYCLQSVGKNVRFIVMNNLLPSTIKLHQKYDLKGSTYKRRASDYEKAKESPTLKDLDLLDNKNGITLDASTFDALMKTISRDCLVLKSFKIMDYSLLLGIHNMDQAIRERQAGMQTVAGRRDYGKRVVRQKTVFSAWESIQTDTAPLDLGEEYPVGGILAHNRMGERLLLFLGIIDILQNYRLFKKMEHSLKSLIGDGDTISVHHPNFYAARFEKFMSEVVFTRVPPTSAPKAVSSKRRSQRKNTNDIRPRVSSEAVGTKSDFVPTKVADESSSNVLPNLNLSSVPLVDKLESFDRSEADDVLPHFHSSATHGSLGKDDASAASTLLASLPSR